jgi:hypothetical protein
LRSFLQRSRRGFEMQPTTMVETAPPPVRCTAVALGYNIS